MQVSQEHTCKETQIQVFSYEISEISKNTYFEEHLRTTACMGFQCFYQKALLWELSMPDCC